MTETRPPRLARRASLAIVCLGLALKAAALLASLRPAPGAAENIEDPPSTPLSGLLTDGARAALQGLRGDTAIVVLLRPRDLSTCEDLGRQLRELRRSAPPAMRLIAVTDAASVTETRDWLRRERMRDVAVFSASLDSFVSGADPLSTPAAVLLYRDELRVQGVAHPQRVRNTRSRSFADELGLRTMEKGGRTGNL